jgi:hypothetical protein
MPKCHGSATRYQLKAFRTLPRSVISVPTVGTCVLLSDGGGGRVSYEHLLALVALVNEHVPVQLSNILPGQWRNLITTVTLPEYW